MDNGPEPCREMIWMLGLELDTELLDGLSRAVVDGYLSWVVIPGAPLRISTIQIPTGTFVP